MEASSFRDTQEGKSKDVEMCQLMLVLSDVEPGLRLDTDAHKGVSGTAYVLSYLKPFDLLKIHQFILSKGTDEVVPQYVSDWLEKLESACANVVSWIETNKYWVDNPYGKRRLLLLTDVGRGGYDGSTYGFPKATVPSRAKIFAEKTVSGPMTIGEVKDFVVSNLQAMATKMTQTPVVPPNTQPVEQSQQPGVAAQQKAKQPSISSRQQRSDFADDDGDLVEKDKPGFQQVSDFSDDDYDQVEDDGEVSTPRP